jgi:DNA-binding MarR family transcriptional regulator
MTKKYTEQSDIKLIALLELLIGGYWYGKEVQQLLKPFDISHEQFNILRILEHNTDHHFSLKEIQKRVMNKTANTTRLVEKLKKKRLITSEYSKTNRRMLEIAITPMGINLLGDIKDPLFQFVDRVKKNFTIKDAEDFIRIVHKIRMAK